MLQSQPGEKPLPGQTPAVPALMLWVFRHQTPIIKLLPRTGCCRFGLTIPWQ